MSGLRIEQTFKEVVKGSTISGAMLKAGYAETTAARTNKVTETQKWKELVAKHISDTKLTKLHDRLLKKEEAIVISDGAQNGSHIEWTKQPHSDSLRALEMGYRLKGKFPKEEGNASNQVLVINISGETDARFKRNAVNTFTE